MKTAIVIGATGLVGKQLIKLLIADKDFHKIIVLSRKQGFFAHEKVIEIIVDFDKIDEFSSLIKGDVLFSTLGTTLKTAGTKEKQYKIDFGYNYETAKIAQKNAVSSLILLSSAGADAKSKVFYSKMKGELDDAVEKLNFEKVKIIRPSMLEGKRTEYRFFERFFTPIMKAFCWIPGLKKYRPIKDVKVAQAMINSFKSDTSKTIYELEEVHQIAKNY